MSTLHDTDTADTLAEREPTAAAAGRHPVNVGHLVMGVAFVGLFVVWLIVGPTDLVDLEDARWLLPLPWLAGGVAGLVATILRRPA